MRAIAAPLKLSSRLLGSRGRIDRRLAGIILIVAALQVAAVLFASWVDDTLTLEGGRGVFQHYGAWAILLTDPLLLVASGFLDRQFCIAMLTLPVRPGPDVKDQLSGLLRKWIRVVRARGYSALLYALFVIVGLFAWIQNVWFTADPDGPVRHPIFAHHDVFDSGRHLWGFVTFKACLFLSWVVVYPIVGFKFLTTAMATWTILRSAQRNCLVLPRVEHPDGCYGLKNVGTLNIAILSPYLLSFFVMFSLLITHQMLYGSILIPLIAVTIIFLISSFVVIWPAHLMLWRARDREYRDLTTSARNGAPTKDKDLLRFTARRLFFSAAKASPYSETTKVVILAMRAMPAAALAFRLLR